MTLPQTIRPPFPLPLDEVIYQQLHTDFYPWTEVAADLASRLSSEVSLAFDIQQNTRWARFIWSKGVLLGGFTYGGREVRLDHSMYAMPRAEVTLVQVSHEVANIIWSCHNVPMQQPTGAWPDMRSTLEYESFYGVLLAGLVCSFWESGEVIGGLLPPIGAICQLYTLNTETRREDQVAFWADLLHVIHQHTPIDDYWKQISLRLSEDYPCLDPFIQDVILQDGRLYIDPSVAVTEFRPAFRAATSALLSRLGLRIDDFPLSELRRRPEWTAAGLEQR